MREVDSQIRSITVKLCLRVFHVYLGFRNFSPSAPHALSPPFLTLLALNQEANTTIKCASFFLL